MHSIENNQIKCHSYFMTNLPLHQARALDPKYYSGGDICRWEQNPRFGARFYYWQGYQFTLG